MPRSDGHRIPKYDRDDTRLQLTFCAIKIRSRVKLSKVGVLTDHRRKLPHVTRAMGNRFEVIFLTDDARLAWHVGYDLAGW